MKKRDWAHILAVILELGAVFFLVQSILSVFPEGKSNWYLPLALVLNCVALFLNTVQWRKQQKRMSGMKKNRSIAVGCSMVATICFGFVSSGNFYRGRMGVGWVFALLTIAQLILVLVNYIILNKMNKSKFEEVGVC